MIKIVKVHKRNSGSTRGYRLKVFGKRVAKLSTLWLIATILALGCGIQAVMWAHAYTLMTFDLESSGFYAGGIATLNSLMSAFAFVFAYRHWANFKIHRYLEQK